MRARILFLNVVSLSVLVFAAQAWGQHNHGKAAAKPSATQNAATQAFRDANEKMHKDMDIAYSGNADTDFLKSMIPHHQGAIDMAKVVLRYGSDPEIKKLAQEIITTQEKEIAMMKEWLRKKR